MNQHVVEVVARFGDTLVDVAYVGPTDVYCIGSAADTNLAVPGYTRFPLVDRGTPRIPTGITATARGATTVLVLGHVTIELTRVKRSTARVALRRPEWRTKAFVLASLVVHVFIYLLAVMLEPFEILVVKQQPRFRFAHIASPPPPIEEPKPQPQPVMPPAAATTGAQHESPAPSAHFDPRRLDALAKDLDKKLADLRPENQYDEDAENARGFGGTGRFDPSNREGFESVASGEYVTMPFDVKLCPDRTCKVTGPFPAAGVRSYLHAHMPAIYDCYQRYAHGPGTIVLEFTITRRYGGDGAVRDAKGRGLGETGACVADLVASIDFKAMEDETRVRYPIRFN